MIGRFHRYFWLHLYAYLRQQCTSMVAMHRLCLIESKMKEIKKVKQGEANESVMR